MTGSGVRVTGTLHVDNGVTVEVLRQPLHGFFRRARGPVRIRVTTPGGNPAEHVLVPGDRLHLSFDLNVQP